MTGTLDALVAEGLVAENVRLARLTTYKMGGPARYFSDVGDEASLDELLRVIVENPALPVLVVGRGSNLVVADAGFSGLAVRLSGRFSEVSIDDEGVVDAGGAAALPVVARTAARAGRGGLEFLVGIPGSVGGAVRMNAGCHGSETADRLLEARVVDLDGGGRRTVGPSGLAMAYRSTNLTDRDLVVGAKFSTMASIRAEIEETMREISRWRKEHQPGGTFNAGSVFKNPPGDAAGRIIDQAGLKGHRVGGARVSERHANFFVADADATAQDVYDLVWEVRRIIADRTGTWLEPEIRFAGTFRPHPTDVRP